MLSLDDHQMDRVRATAAQVPVDLRDRFLKIVANVIGEQEPTAANVNRAVSIAMDSIGVAVGRQTNFARRPPSKPGQSPRSTMRAVRG